MMIMETYKSFHYLCFHLLLVTSGDLCRCKSYTSDCYVKTFFCLLVTVTYWKIVIYKTYHQQLFYSYFRLSASGCAKSHFCLLVTVTYWKMVIYKTYHLQ
ncbi:hypothetical protein DPMN_010975 [Dreissena polymorpha]|uniref:Uncharacterized protein n=1 Tax=Dreissena polymorpha TaxID=45954 RepID=A0A9D4N577_DREPO|nr:hypothetical protein DPMN_010975 [Dreissena polymorpha]